MSTLPEYGVLRFSNVAHAYTHLFMMLYPTVVLALEAVFHLPYDQLLTLSIAGYVLFGAGALPAGWLADRWSSTGMLSVFFIGIGMSAIATGLAHSPMAIAVGLGLIGLFASIYHPVGTAMIVRNPERRGRALGINGVFGGLGTAAGAVVAGLLIDAFGWRAAFIVPGALSVATGLGFVGFVHGRTLQAFPHDKPSHGSKDGSAALWLFAMLFVILLCSGMIFQSTQVALPKIFALRTIGVGDGVASVGSKVSLVYLVAGLTQIVGGHLADRYAPRYMFMAAYLVMIPVALLSATLYGIPLLLASLLLISINVGMLPVTDSLFTDMIPPRWRATVFGAKFVVSLGISALGVPLVATIFSRTGSFAPLFTILGGFAACIALAALMLPAHRRQAPRPLPDGETVPSWPTPNLP